MLLKSFISVLLPGSEQLILQDIPLSSVVY